jgi:exodeoxyribonuclease VII small subunit
MTDDTAETPPTLESRIDRLERILAALESDRLELDEALALFEEGVKHVREAEKLLARTELQIERLIGGPGGPAFEPVPPE